MNIMYTNFQYVEIFTFVPLSEEKTYAISVGRLLAGITDLLTKDNEL